MIADLRYFARLFEHDCWANAEALRALEVGRPPARAVRWMAHIVGSEHLWLARLRQEAPTVSVWPDIDLDGCATRLEELAGLWPILLGELDPEDLDDGRAYRNTRGEFWTSTVGDILTHVAMHSAYHRGQIASAVREAGSVPAYTDFIHAVRQGLIE
ncbi:MAG: DinB family protein [Gemmatimonadales bacterium]